MSDGDGKGSAADEVVVPDDVRGPGDEPAADDAGPVRRDRRPLWALIAGLAAVWFTLFGPLLAMILAPVAIVLGHRALRRVQLEGGTDSEKRQAKIGLVAGIVAAVFILLQIVLFQLFFEWEKRLPDLEAKGEAGEETEPGEGTEEPATTTTAPAPTTTAAAG